MPMEAAQASAASKSAQGWWGGLGLYAKIAVGVVTSALVLTIIIVPIVVASGGGDDDAAAASTTLSLRVLNYTGLCDGASQTLHYRTTWAASGSANSVKPSWEGTLYIKGDGAGCVEAPGAADAAWPFVMGQSMTLPTLPAGYSNSGLSMWNDTATGNLHLKSGACLTYYYTSDTAAAWWAGVSASWHIVRAEQPAVAANANPPCQDA